MKMIYGLVTFSLIICYCFAAPTKVKDEPQRQDETNPENLQDIMHYHRYLQQVVSALETDPDFKKKLEAANETEIRSGKIANHLEFVNHHVRTQLDEYKRQELERLKFLAKQQHELRENRVEDDSSHGHLDHVNPHTFEVEDLKKLIAKTTEDLAEADRKRREEFKQYEMQKEFEKFDKLNHTNGSEKEKLEKEFQEMEMKHKKHEPLHEPGHKAQLEEVWEEQDHMQSDFNPKAFFMMHDLDSNGLWDQDEVKALFIKELDKMYSEGAPEDDMNERLEEMERMREAVFQEVDTNRDGFIDYNEFVTQTKRQDFQQDNGWKTVDEDRPYTNEELEAYIRQQQMMHNAPPPYYPPPGQAQYHPNQIPQGAYHIPPGQQQFHGNPQLNMNEMYPNQQQHPNFQQQQQQQQQQHYQQQQPNLQQQHFQQPPPNIQQHYQQQQQQQQPNLQQQAQFPQQANQLDPKAPVQPPVHDQNHGQLQGNQPIVPVHSEEGKQHEKQPPKVNDIPKQN